MSLHEISHAAYEKLEQILGSVFFIFGYVQNLGAGVHPERIVQKIVDGFIGLAFLAVGTVVVHYIKKWLEKKSKNEKEI